MASVFEKYPNLPGFATEFKDGGLQVRTETIPPGTESILFLGTAVDGPVGEPVAVNPNNVELIFGSSTTPTGIPNGATLVKAFHEAWQAGCRDIRLMRITGETAKATIKGAPIARSVETTIVKNLGVAPGNAETEFILNAEDIDVDSVIVNAEGYDLPPTAYTVTNGSAGTPAKVTLHADQVSAGASIYITYKDNATGVTVTENGTDNGNGDITYWVAEGADATFQLGTTAKPETFHLYADGVEVPKADYTLDAGNTSVTIKAGRVAKGAQLEASFVHAEVTTEEFQVKLESVFAGAVYNQIKVRIEEVVDTNDNVIGKKVVITKPESKKAQVTEKDLEYSSLDYPTLGQLVQAINGDPRNNVVRASVANRHADLKTVDLQSTTPFTGGSDGLDVSKQELYEILGGHRDANGVLVEPGIYHLLENYTVDIIVPLGVYADDVLPGKYDNFAAQLALACAVISHQNSATIGMIATSSPDEAGLAAVQAHVEKLLEHKNDYFMRDRAGNILKDSQGNPIDLGRFIQIVAGPDLILNSTRLGTYAENSVAAYAGFVSQLPAQSSPTNKVLPFARGLRFSYSNSQLDKLTEARYVTFKFKNNGQNVAVVDAPTAAQPNSDYRRISTIRVVKEVVNQVREVCDPYVGEPNEIPQRNAMSAAIAKRLDKLVEEGVIVDYDFVVIATPQMQLMGEAQIELTIIPPQELRRITTIVALRPSL